MFNAKENSVFKAHLHTDESGVSTLQDENDNNLLCNKIAPYIRPTINGKLARNEFLEPACISQCPDCHVLSGKVIRTCGHFPVEYEITQYNKPNTIIQ